MDGPSFQDFKVKLLELKLLPTEELSGAAFTAVELFRPQPVALRLRAGGGMTAVNRHTLSPCQAFTATAVTENCVTGRNA